ncbi:MAG: virulence factor [Desulfobacterota bacterium]|nr:virulence factor [Thermodesulfobacteriota bacterium]
MSGKKDIFRVVFAISLCFTFIFCNHLLFTQEQNLQKENSLRGIPLIEVPAKTDSGDDLLAVILTGDGGWRKIDKEIAEALSYWGIPVVGLNTLKYFWKRRTKEEASLTLDRIIRTYLGKWEKKRVVLVGYCFGADLLPFMANRLPQDTLDKVLLIALLGPGHMVDFKFHPTYWLGGESGGNPQPVLPEVKKLRGKKILCFCGEAENNSLCREMESGLAKIIILPGGHHFGGNYRLIGKIIHRETATFTR